MDPSNPYQSPAASIRATGKPLPQDIPEEIRKDIRNGAVAAVITFALTLGMTWFYVYVRPEEGVTDAWSFLDVGLIAALAFGIWRKSRVAATAMLIYFVLSKILEVVDTGKPGGILLTIAFIYYYYKAMVATYRYHRFLKQWRHAPEVSAPETPSAAVIQPPPLPGEPSAPA